MKLLELAKPAAALCKSNTPLSELLNTAPESARGFVLLLDPRIDQGRILPAYFNAIVKEQGKIAKAKKPSIEMLLFLCGKSDIAAAIKECGAKTSRKFILFSSSCKLLKQFEAKERIHEIKRLSLDFDLQKAASVAEVDA
ncbi:MAG: hypothetical protein ACP5T4_00295 [Candidatus Micrarchaeia archaeon]